MSVNYYPPKIGGSMNLDTLCLIAIAVGVWVLVIAGTNAI